MEAGLQLIAASDNFTQGDRRFDHHRSVSLEGGNVWSMRTIIFYGLSVVLWLSYFYAFFRLRRSIGG